MIQQTSIDAHNEIKANGLLTGIKWMVYAWLFENGPATQKEVCAGLEMDVRTITPRFAEMLRDGAIQILPDYANRPCRHTGHVVSLWDVTPNLPKKAPQTENMTFWGVFEERSLFVAEGHRIFDDKWKADGYAAANGGVVVKLRRVK